METINEITGMKALSITMPWAWLILKFGKDVENRTWRTDYRGRILIHATKKPDPNWRDILADAFHPGKFGEKFEEKWREINRTWCGCIVGSVELVDCTWGAKDVLFSSPWAEPEMYHWVLKNEILLKEPIPVRGSLGLWEYKGDEKR